MKSHKNELSQLFQLKPGEIQSFLGFYFEFLTDLGEFQQILKDNFTEACRWSIDDSFFKNALKDSKYVIVVWCIDSDNDKGVKGFIFGKDAKNDDEGVYINLVCASEMFYIENNNSNNYVKINYKLGLLLRAIFLTYAGSIGKTNAYLGASNIDLISVYNRTGWTIKTAVCGEEDDVSNIFINNMNKKELVELLSKYKYTKSDGSFAMKLCNFNIKTLQQHTIKSIIPVISELTNEQIKSMCLFA